MKKKLLIGLAVLIAGVFIGNNIVLAQPTAVIKVVAMSPQDLTDRGLDLPTSSGLTVVGKGELIYLVGANAGTEEVISYLWSLDSVPTGSLKGLDSTATKTTTFVPDTTGQFVIKLQITTASGVAETTVKITSALYVGASGLPPSCQYCHDPNYKGWQETGHSTFFAEAIDGIKSAGYNVNCIKCHTVGFNTFPSAVNGGFDDVQADLGWVFPDTLQDGNWADIMANFQGLAQKANIQCENCHGPGSEHMGDKTKIDFSMDEGVCGQCHDALSHHVKNNQWAKSRHGMGLANRAESSSCARCHSSYGFVASLDPAFAARGKVLGEPRITCAACHDPHSVNNPHQLRKVEDVELGNGVVVSFGNKGRLCMNCHISRRNADTYVQQYASHFGPHHSNQTDMIAGTNAVDFGFNIPSSNHKGVVPDLCITCHMSPTPSGTGENEIGEHTWNMHWDGGTPEDPSDDVDNVSACVNCHGPVTSFEDFIAKQDYDRDGTVESVQHEIEGLMDLVGELLPPYGSPEVVVTSEYTPTELRAAYNYAFVHDDGSHGIHNFQFALNLLRVAHEALTTGDLGAGTIMEISDVPNDQGKNVRIVWSRFSGDGVGNLPIEEYALWRRVDDYGRTPNGLGKAVKTVGFDDVVENLGKLEVGTRVVMQLNGRGMDTELWDFAGTVPAAGLAKYSAIAPTLFDSTAADGVHWSAFVVTGHTEIPAVFVVSECDSGYSVDNLAPAAPDNVVAKETVSGIAIEWNESSDEDFKYFSVYRGTESEFDPKEPVANTTDPSFTDANVVVGSTYYYRVTSTDFSGNESELSVEIPLLVTSVQAVDLGVIPAEFTLYQNYPNPFNPSTEISFGLPNAENVRIVVYNILGAQVKVLTDDVYAPGNYKLLWNGDDERGNQVGPGMYIYRFESNSTMLTKKMMFIK